VIGGLEPTMQSTKKKQSGLPKLRQRGTEMLEFTLVFLPFLGFMFLILNIAYAVYQRSTIQYAVAQGTRYAVTSQTMTGLGARSSIQQVVVENSSGVLSGCGSPPTATTNPWCGIYVDWGVSNADGSYTSTDGVTGGNCMTTDGTLPLVEVSVQSLPGKLLVPFVTWGSMGSLKAITTGAYSWDRMEAPAVNNGGYVCPSQ